jgi:hypothetical protein
MAGATGSVLPTTWASGSIPAGFTFSIGASGQATANDGTLVNYVDVSVSGTATASGTFNLFFSAATGAVTATTGQTFTLSAYATCISGDITTPAMVLQVQEVSGSTFQAGTSTNIALASGAVLQRLSAVRAFNQSGLTAARGRIGHPIVSGTTYSYTIRIASPQLERLGVATPMIATSTGAVTRLNESTDVVGLPPDFTVSRNTGATRVGPNGLIEAGNTNLAFHSESWVSGNNWGLLLLTNATGAIAAPNGTITANALSPTAVSGVHFMTGNSSTTVIYTSGTIYTQSAFFKAGTGAAGQLVQLTFASARFTQEGYANFDLSAGTVSVVSGSSADANRAAKIENYGNGWYRCIFTATCNITGTGVSLIPVLITASGSGRTPSFTGVTGDILYAWGAQVEVGSTASEYIPTTTVARTRFAGVTVDGTIAANIPRIDWLGQSCPALLVEPSGQNVARWVNQMTAQDTPAASGGMTITTGSTDFLAPDGTSGSITKYVGGAASGTSQNAYYSGGQIVATASGAHTFSLFVKRGATNPLDFCAISFSLFTGASGTAISYFNLASGTAITAGASIQDYGNGWYRLISAPYTIASGDLSGQVVFNMAATSGSLSFAASGALNLTAYTWGAQFETGSVATTYIPTTTGAVSRAADVISASGALVSGLIGQTEGTIYAEFEIRSDSTTRRLFGLSDGTQLNRVFLYYTSNALRAQIQSTDISLGNPAAGYHKVAFAYQQSGVSGTLFASLDGGAVVSGTAGTFPSALKEVFFGKREDSADTQQWNARIRAAALYTTRLSNDQLAELTRL